MLLPIFVALYESGLAFSGLTLCAVPCSYATVYKCSFLDGKTGALKLFRNTKEESAAKEIEMMFSLRHPNVIGIYAWFREPGQFLQSAVVRLRVARPEQVWELEGQAFRGGFDAPLLPSLCLRLAASLQSQL